VAEGESIHPTWSPDGKRILFNTTWFVKARKTKEAEQVIGEKIDEQMDLATVRPDGSDLSRLTTGGGYTYASFSPDGRWIVHRRVQGDSSKIFLMKADGSSDRDLSGASTLDGWPAWSSDGNRIVFSRRGPAASAPGTRCPPRRERRHSRLRFRASSRPSSRRGRRWCHSGRRSRSLRRRIRVRTNPPPRRRLRTRPRCRWPCPRRR